MNFEIHIKNKIKSLRRKILKPKIITISSRWILELSVDE